MSVNDQWEEIPNPDPGSLMIDISSHRLRIPDGWIVRTIACNVSTGGGIAVSHTFVHDPVHQWELETQPVAGPQP
jgi:hypothetical protein